MKIKLFSVSINAKNVVSTFVEEICLEYFSEDLLVDLIPSAFGILVYNSFISREIRFIELIAGPPGLPSLCSFGFS